MPKTGNFLHQASSTEDVAAVDTNYNAARKSLIRLKSTPSDYGVGAILSAVYVKVKSIAGGAAKLSIQISTDALGDNIIVPSTEATMGTGVTTATVGAAVYDLSISFVSSSDSLYVFCKTDAGTVTVDSVDISWRE